MTALPEARKHADEWYGQAACGDDPEAMFPGTNADKIRKAKQVCAPCPVKLECLKDALADEGGRSTRHGIRGGMNPSQRRRIHSRGHTAEQALARRQSLLGGLPPVGTLAEAFERRATAAPDGHLLWSGTQGVTFQGVRYAPSRASFLLAYGREPVGKVLRTCDVTGCFAGGCLADQTMRDAA